VDPKRSSAESHPAPSRSASSATARLPSAGEPPPIDARLVEPETREQLLRGRRLVALPAHPPHGDRHFRLDYVIGAHVKDGYVGSTDLLTRSAERSDFATDTCVRREGIDPTTNTRYLEELAFEVVNEQSLQDITEQAEDLSARGVRRVVAIFVKKGEACEWSAKKGEWERLDPEDTFSDPTLVRPLRVRELLDADEADNAVARALLAKKNPLLAQILTEGEEEGLTEGEKKGFAEGEKKGLRRGIEIACELLEIELTEERRARMNELDASGLKALLAHLCTARRLP
jgi:hypothetical protein